MVLESGDKFEFPAAIVEPIDQIKRKKSTSKSPQRKRDKKYHDKEDSKDESKRIDVAGKTEKHGFVKNGLYKRDKAQ